jgi:diaminohydroxyphosphoribosylaminopyrimidine deaminase/5-amino-6-(5-phosphoribosylamino)uracil reductase
MHDTQHMRAALALARRGLGTTWPNPSVGCVLVRDGLVVARGRTASGGRPHAEAVALAEAGERARGATAYVTLEPCAHHGQTPPCADALAAAGIARVVIASADPDPRVDGQGIARLRAAGVMVETGLLAAEGEEVHAGFLSRVRLGRPLVTLKLATTLDGRIATPTGESKWITGPEARRASHVLRGRHDAVLVGANTVAKDDPDLTCRLPGFRERPLVRVVLDSTLRISPESRLVRTARDAPVWVVHREAPPPAARDALLAAGVTLMAVPGAPAGVDMAAALRALGDAGLTRVLAEGGGGIAAGLLGAGLVDRVAWFHAPLVIGGDGLAACYALGLQALGDAPRFVPEHSEAVGSDRLTWLRRVG